MACGLWLKQPGVYLLAFLASRRLKALGFGSGLLHVLAVLGLAKMLRALAVVNLAISIYPNLTRCSSSGGGSGCINRFFRWRSSSNSSRRSLRSSRSRRFCSTSSHAGRSSEQTQNSTQRFNFHDKAPIRELSGRSCFLHGCINRFFRWRSSSNSSRRSLRSSRSRCSSRSASSASGHNSRSSKQAQSSEQNFGFHGKYPEKYNNILM